MDAVEGSTRTEGDASVPTTLPYLSRPYGNGVSWPGQGKPTCEGRRATIKAHPAAPHHPRPYGSEGVPPNREWGATEPRAINKEERRRPDGNHTDQTLA